MRVGAAVGIGIAALAACGEPRELASPGIGGGFGECATCHSAPGEALPFRSARGQPGAHDPHLAGQVTRPLACTDCHNVPTERDDPGHLEDSPEDVIFGQLARTGGATPTYEQGGCAASYCHGNFPGGNANNRPVWLAPRQDVCGTCHGVPPATGRHAIHVSAGLQCQNCHGTLLSPTTHVNGTKDVPLTAWRPTLRSCAQACHSARSWDQ